MNTKEIRSLFPITEAFIYLNSASQAPLNTLVNDKLQTLIKSELNFIDKKGFNRDDVRLPLSKILGGSPDEYALTTSTGVGLGMVAQGIDFKKGDNVVIPEKEHWNNTFPWLNLESKGVEVRFAKLNKDNSLDSKAIEKLIDNKTRVVAVAAVRFNSGFRPNLSKISKIAHANNALFVVDAAQGAGMVPIDVEKDQIDVMSGCGFKWLLGMHGTGFLYVSKRVVKTISPILPGMFAAPAIHDQLSYHTDSRKFETGTIAYSLFSAWSAGLQLILNIGVENIYEKALQNTDLIIADLQAKGYEIVTPIEEREGRTAIVHFKTSAFETTKVLFEKLKENKILLTLQGENIRISPNFFTTEEEISSFLALI
ncbi:aminotransferase [Polaribacter sp. ALD11]|uniref:aminotransferase class V-fold PLP-dependent enzyme n=1 Tax=Polaribacter sp. ALD11 TaxID=2058137 RepID=UPI000C308E3D|nr:aminotransferase class V-fold PLP-dependent enzyme [Polaribacter sp. ALD11]AUC83942.1 aminotransferase [Polaribacter sp. ALD11]